MPGFKPLKPVKPSAAASTKPGRQPLLLQGCSLPFPGRQRSSIAGFKPLKHVKPSAAASTKPGRQPLLLQGCSLPFPGRQRSSIAAALCLHSLLLLRHSSPPFARLQTPKTRKTLRGSFHQAWPSAFAAPGLQLSWPSAFQHCSLPFACTAFSC